MGNSEIWEQDHGMTLGDEVRRLREENERLRAALREIGKCSNCYGHGDVYVPLREKKLRCKDCSGTGQHPIAQAALKGEQ